MSQPEKSAFLFSNQGVIDAGNIVLNTVGGTAGNLYSLNASGDLTVTGPLSVNAGYNVTSNIQAGGQLNITAESGDIRFVNPKSNSGSVLIAGKEGVNIQAKNGHLVMKNDADKNKINVSSVNGSVSLSGSVQDGTDGLSLTNIAITSEDKTTLAGTTFWGKAAALSGLDVTAKGDVDITGNAQNLSNEYLGSARTTRG